MKHVKLLSPAYANGGRYIDAGNTVPVGDGKEAITDERAKDIVHGKRAEYVDVAADGEPAKGRTKAAA